jgi:hypothetical protein
VRRPRTDHKIESVRGVEAGRVAVMEGEALVNPELDRGLSRSGEGAFGDVDAVALQTRLPGQGAQQPFPAAAAQVQHPLGAGSDAVPEQEAYGVVVQRGRYGVIGMGEARDLLTVHRRSLAVPLDVRT